MSGPLLSLQLAILLLITSPAVNAQNYTASELPAPEWPDEIISADMNGNGRLDLIMPVWSANSGRQLEIFLQQADGRFSASPSRRIDIRPDIIAFTLADIRPMPGQELILISNSAAYSLSTMIPGYENNLEKLFDWDFLASIPDRQRTLFLPPPQDINGNGHVDLLLPGREDYGLFPGQNDGSFSLAHRFSTENDELDPEEFPLNTGRFDTEITINERDGLLVRIVPRSNSAFEDFLENRMTGSSDDDYLLSFRNRIPGAISARIHPGAGQSILFSNIGDDLRARINILRPPQDDPDGDLEHWYAPANDEGEYQLLDFTGNGLMDIIRVDGDESNHDVHFYRNRDGQFDFDSPDQVMRFSGYDPRISALDLDANGQPELLVTYYTIPATAAIRNASINRVQLIYSANGSASGQIFNTRPNSRNEESFSASAVRGLSEAINFQADINDNGRKDALYLTGDGTLAAKAVGQDLHLASDPFWHYVPGRTITGFDVQDLNGNGRPDILLHHSTTTTILMSAP